MKITIKSILTVVLAALLLVSGVAQVRPQQSGSAKTNGQTGAAAQSNTPGRIARFTDSKFLTDSNIMEDSSGNIGIGTTLPTSPLTVKGIIEMLNAGSGIKFPDGTLQTTAGLATVSRDATLKGDGTQASPLGVGFPLIVNGQLGARGVIQATNSSPSGIGVVGNGHATGVTGTGGDSDNFFGGRGMIARGGTSNTFVGGIGMDALGGASNGYDGGVGVNARGGDGITFGGVGVNTRGGDSASGHGGDAIYAVGGDSFTAGKKAGTGLVAFGGIGINGATRGLAGFFAGDVQVTGVLSKGGGSFKIDHPLDPENKYLSHSFVESPDMMNIYNGNITTDDNGRATVELPDYFDSLNRDFRYQLTVVGQFAQAIVAEEVKDNRFTIQTSAPGVKVSWQVTGVRQDSWANKNRIKVEENKSETERGYYLHPQAFGKPEERGVEWANSSEFMRELKQRRLEGEQSRPPRN